MGYINYFLVASLLYLFMGVSYGQDVGGCYLTNHKQSAINHWSANYKKELLISDNWLTVEQILEGDVKNIVWVDVRSKPKQIDVPLERVVSLSLIKLGDSQFLFDHFVVLIGTGFDQLQLDHAISHLRQIGFKHVFALYGGVRVWNSLKQQKISLNNEISPEEFFLGGKTIPWKVITVGLSDQDIESLPEKPTKQFDVSAASIKELIGLINEEQLVSSSFINWVLVTDDKKTLHYLKQQLHNSSLSEQLVWLQGGFRNYQNYIKQQHEIIANAGLSLSRSCGLVF
ncbi:hypothetical protein [Entomomonas asaccharolytica]|uniref:Rhodanese domain-containing protein n=1 Tax=Entomomonas asaccharolytica TaxID=2785331 RepID=A0A974NDR5_9GAMM|nr:hypothetical protein [Entomomonas asaccharolytica]QQP84811.1 hypothetical protein JHT90_10405 [Entomomonas asaccharolytica]